MTGRIISALGHIPAHDRAIWVSMAFAVKSELGDAGFAIWDDWSQQAENYDPKSAKAVWRSAKSAGKITIASLYHEAMANGWKGDGQTIPARSPIAAHDRVKEAQEIDKRRQAAAKKAGWMLKQSKLEKHAYLDSKGFPDLTGMVWRPNENLLLIPMRIGHSLSGLQMITREGEKKFLSGAITKGAEYLIDNKGMDWYCEGYATALSLRAVLHALKLRYRIHCCFSAHNLTCMAKQTAKAYIIADHDQSGTGEQAAKDAAHPYWISQVMGEDMNDAHKRLGVFRLSQEIRAWLKGDGS